MNKDLGTYWVRVELKGGCGWLHKFETGQRYTNGNSEVSPLNAQRILPTWESESELISTIIYMFTEGGCSCDSRKLVYLAEAYQRPVPYDPPCGDEMPVVKLTLIRPDTTEVLIYSAGGCK